MEIKAKNGIFQIDEEDLPILKQGYCYISGRDNGRVRQEIWKNGKVLSTFLHRRIMGLEKGDKRVVDHINHDGLDNRRENLRVCTSSQNSMNRIHKEGLSSKYKGVSWDKFNKVWVADIAVNGRKKRIGNYKSEEKAAKEYNAWAKVIFGDFAVINKI